MKLRTILETYLRKQIKRNPKGNLFTRLLMWFYDIIYLRKDARKHQRFHEEQFNKQFKKS